MKNKYKFCSICGGGLKQKNGNLGCMRCSFVNYLNPRPTATALILHKNKILMVRRKKAPFKGWWDLPGGFLDKGETPEHALTRELKEEIGLTVLTQKLFGVYTGTYRHPLDPCYILTVVYLVRPRTDKIRVRDTNELLYARWFSRRELPPKIAFDSNQKIIKDFIKIWPA